MKRQQDGRYDLATTKLALAIRSNLDPYTNRTHEDALYHALRKAVYGIPGRAIDVADLVHALADLRGEPDPSGSEGA